MGSNNYEPLPEVLVPTMAEETQCCMADSDQSSPEEIVRMMLDVNLEKDADIERATRGQANYAVWYQERTLRITSSMFCRVCKRRATTLSDRLVSSIINQKMYCSIPKSCKWGKDNEEKAVNAYKRKMHDAGHFRSDSVNFRSCN